MFEKSYSGKCRWIQVFSSIWRSKDWTITLVQSVYHIGAHPDHRAVQCLQQKGIDISMLRARQFVQQDFARFDFIYAMDASNYKNIVSLAKTDDEKRKVKMYLNEVWPEQDRAVPDPWFGDADGFEEVFEMLNAASESLTEKLNSK